MKKWTTALAAIWAMAQSATAQTLEHQIYFYFGSDVTNSGQRTVSPDAKGNYRNSITNNPCKYAAKGSRYESPVYSGNTPGSWAGALGVRFSTNGMSGGSGLLSPDASKPGELPIETCVLKGTAAENGISEAMHAVSATGGYTGLFECYTRLNPGEFVFTTTDTEGNETTWGLSDGKIKADAAAVAQSDEAITRVRVDFLNKTIETVPVTSWGLTGSVVPGGWTLTDNANLDYLGNGVWSATVNLDRVSTVSDPERFVFIMNKSRDYQMKQIDQSAQTVGLTSDGFSTSDIRLNHGTYTVTLDLDRMVFDIDRPGGIDENRISVFGSSVANGQGATDNHGYAYMYGRQLGQRYQDGLSTNPFYISGIAINGNNTLNLLARYNDLIHDFGRYVIFGLSLGNEGIHGAANQEAIYRQFSENMSTLVAKARADGKIPVVMNNYTRGDYTAEDYAWIRKMNLRLNSWDVPVINLLGAIDNGTGKWADGYMATNDSGNPDIYHPTTEGHSEFMYAMSPSLFDAIAAGKALPERHTGNTYTLGKGGSLSFVPEGTVHPFALSVTLAGEKLPSGRFMTISGEEADASLTLNGTTLTYTAPDGSTISGDIAGDRTFTLSHYYAQGRTLLYAGERLLGETAGRFAPEDFVISNPEQTEARTGRSDDAHMALSEVSFWRSALNADEVKAHNDGTMMRSSLELYMPFEAAAPGANLAQSLAVPTLVQGSLSNLCKTLSDNTGAPVKAVAGGL